MPKTKKTISYTFYVLSFPVLILVAAAVIGGFIGSNAVNISKESVLSSKNTNNGSKTNKANSRSQEHKIKTEEATTNIVKVAKVERSVGNSKAGEDLDQVAETIVEEADDTAEAIEEVEDRPGWKTTLLGPDFKNLGQLRSTLAHNTNTLRKLSKTIDSVVAGGSDTTLQDQLTLLNAEREKIRALLQEQEGKFSLLGWVSRFLSGYDNPNNGGIVPLTPESSESTDSVLPE